MSHRIRNPSAFSLLLVAAVVWTGTGQTGAQTWESGNTGTTKPLNDVTFLSASLLVGVGDKDASDFNIISSTDGGASLDAAVVNGAPAKNLEAVTFEGATGLAVGQAGTILRSTDSGATWDQVASSTSKELKAVTFINVSTPLAVGKSGTIVRSVDGGVTWYSPGSPTGKELDAIAVNGGTVIGVGKSGTIVRSTDSGVTWSEPASPTGKQLRAVEFVSPSTVVAVGNNGTIVRSADGGATWSSQASSTTKELKLMLFNNGTIVVAAGKKTGSDFTIVRSTDAGLTWSPVSVTGDPGQNLDAAASKGSFMIAVGKKGSIVSSEDDGETWSTQDSGILDDLKAVAVINPVIIVGQNGTFLLSSSQPSAGAGPSAPASVLFGGFEHPLPLPPSGVQEVYVDFGAEWLFLLLALGYGAYRIRY